MMNLTNEVVEVIEPKVELKVEERPVVQTGTRAEENKVEIIQEKKSQKQKNN